MNQNTRCCASIDYITLDIVVLSKTTRETSQKKNLAKAPKQSVFYQRKNRTSPKKAIQRYPYQIGNFTDTKTQITKK